VSLFFAEAQGPPNRVISNVPLGHCPEKYTAKHRSASRTLGKNDRINTFMLWLFADRLKDTHETGVGMFQPANTDIEANAVC
jgi:hypothetical protein